MDEPPSASVTPLLCVDTGSAADRIAVWNDIVCDQLIAVDCAQIRDRTTFGGKVERRKCGDVDVCKVEAGGQTVTRSPRHLARAEDDYFLVNVQRCGTSIIRQDGRETRLEVGDLSIYSSNRKYELLFDSNFRQSVLIIPAPLLLQAVPNADQLVAQRVVRSACTELVSGSIDLALDIQATSSSQSLHHLSAAIVQLLAAELSLLSDSRHLSRSQTYLLERIKKFIGSQIDNPDLCPLSVAAEFSISVPTLHRLFSAEKTTFMSSIWKTRLDLCRRDLEVLDKHVSIGEIAFRWGYRELSHFSRSFKSRFGATPSEYRNLSHR